MVDYPTWTEIGHEVYKSKGGAYTGSSSAQQVTSVLAEFWSQNTETLREASRSEAQRIAEREMTV
jgi:hypothetical protein